MRTCSVCGTEIDKTTAYTVSGEQKAQGRRCINCVEGAAPAKPDVTKPEPQAAPVAESVAPQVKPEPAASVSQPVSDEAPKGISKTTYLIAAIAVIVVLLALSD